MSKRFVGFLIVPEVYNKSHGIHQNQRERKKEEQVFPFTGKPQ